MDDNQFDGTLRGLAGDPEPTPADRSRSRRALNAAIADARHRSGTKPARGWKDMLVPGLVGTVAVFLLFVALVVWQLGQPTGAEAAFGEIAQATELVDPLTIPAQHYAYSRSEQIVEVVEPVDAFDSVRDHPMAYLLPETREMWVGEDGIVQLRITARTPQFFSAQDEAYYYTAGFGDRDNIGEPVTETFTGTTSIVDERQWPTDPDELKATIVSLLPESYGRPLGVEILDSALDLIREPAAPPSLRAAAIRVIAGLDLTLTKRTGDGGGTFAVTYDGPQRITMTITIDGEGQLLNESTNLPDGDPTLGIPAGTVVSQANYNPTQIVDTLD
jgi:hypothetical protein